MIKQSLPGKGLGWCWRCTAAVRGTWGADTPKFVFGVADIQAARAELVAKGVNIDEVRSAAPGVWVCDGRDPEGNPFSLESHN